MRKISALSQKNLASRATEEKKELGRCYSRQETMGRLKPISSHLRVGFQQIKRGRGKTKKGGKQGHMLG